jgi:inorganic triphosphatase YgiF
MQQLELTVELSTSDLRRLAGELCEDPTGGLPPGTRRRTIYFDTPEHNLYTTGLSVRLSRQDGHWLQTIKASRDAADGASRVVEWVTPVVRREPDLAKIADKNIRHAVQKAVRGTSLNPVFETVVLRTSRKKNAQTPPLAVDGGVQSEEKAELTVKADNADGLLLAVEKLLRTHELKLSRHSNIERVYRLSEQSETRAKPEKARPAHIARKNTCREAFSAILASAIKQIAVNRQAVLHNDDPEGAHQLRISLRRLRSALRALRPLADGDSLRAFERSAREMGRCVGTLRDADVLASEIAAPMQRVASDKSGFAELDDALVRHQQERRAEIRSALRAARNGQSCSFI